MHTVVVRLDPRELTNPDPAIRDRFPERVRELAGGIVADYSWDVAKGTSIQLVTLRVSDLPLALEIILNLIDKERILGNDLRNRCAVAVQSGEHYQVVYPAGFSGLFPE